HPRAPHPLPTRRSSDLGTAGHANEATLEAMWRGASDYVLKPRGLLPDALGPFLRADLFPRIRALAGRAGGPGAGSGHAPTSPDRSESTRLNSSHDQISY